MPDDGDLKLPPKWSAPLSSAPEWKGMHNCTCVGRKPGMAHWEDCPRAEGRGGGADPALNPASQIDWASEAKRAGQLLAEPIPQWSPSAALLRALEVWREQFRPASYISDAAQGVIAAHDEVLKHMTGPIQCQDAHLGLATTERLLEELETRGRVEAVNVYQKAGRELAEECARLRRELPPAMKAYRTVDPR